VARAGESALFMWINKPGLGKGGMGQVSTENVDICLDT
jgi:hypothetical protein